MNLQYTPALELLRVIIVNPLAPASQLIAIKILSGTVFGCSQLVDLILLVYSNEIPSAEAFKLELDTCALPCTNSILVSSDLPSVSDADVFCFITNFTNPNFLDCDKIDDEQFDTLYLIIKIANNLSVPIPPVIDKTSLEKLVPIKRKKEPEKKPRKPIMIADGMVAIDILKSMSKNLPSDIFFCPTPLGAIAKTLLADHLKVNCNVINDVFVWAANDDLFYVDIDKPMIIYDRPEGSLCKSDMYGRKVEEIFQLDHTQFSPSWLKKEFLQKVATMSSKNPHGCIYKAAEFSKALSVIWVTRSHDNDGKKAYGNMGVISDGSLGTIKGYPYVLPLVFSGDSWCVNTRSTEENHLQQEIKRINKAVKEHHQKLIPYCKKFLVQHVIKQQFIPVVDVDSSTTSNTVFSSSESKMRKSTSISS